MSRYLGKHEHVSASADSESMEDELVFQGSLGRSYSAQRCADNFVGLVGAVLCLAIAVFACCSSTAAARDTWGMYVFVGFSFLGSCVFLVTTLLAEGGRLTLSLSHGIYDLRKGLWPFTRTTSGDLSEISHVSLSILGLPGPGKGGPNRRHLVASLVWKDGTRFELRSARVNGFGVSVATAKTELEPIVTKLAAKLAVSVIDLTTLLAAEPDV